MQKRLVFVNNALMFQDHVTWDAVSSMFHRMCTVYSSRIGITLGANVTSHLHGHSRTLFFLEGWLACFTNKRKAVQVHCRFTSTETIRTIRDGEPRTATTTLTQLLSSMSRGSSSVLLYVHRDHKDYIGTGSSGRPFWHSHSS